MSKLFILTSQEENEPEAAPAGETAEEPKVVDEGAEETEETEESEGEEKEEEEKEEETL